jgi:glycosyltransferase involved in cell wall biosynthesis
MSTTQLYFAGESNGDSFGWGVCLRELRRELEKLVPVKGPEIYKGLEGHWTTKAIKFPGAVFMPLIDHNFNATQEAFGDRNLAYCFFESELGPWAKRNAKKYDVVFCGSTWCLARMMGAGITNGKVLIQGVDHEIFYPTPMRDGREFRIFSGGKFEYRKGQDLVLAAFREINRKFPFTRLVTAWQNPWPALCDSMQASNVIKYEPAGGKAWPDHLRSLCLLNGVDPTAVTTLPGLIPNREMANVYRECDIGLFPNRCEGGTNLVAMEFMACGRPIVTHSLTGHADIWNPGMMLYLVSHDKNLWAESKVEDIVAAVERAIAHRDSLQMMGDKAAEHMKQFTWERAAKTIVDSL